MYEQIPWYRPVWPHFAQFKVQQVGAFHALEQKVGTHHEYQKRVGACLRTGTGDAQINLAQRIPLSGALVVSTPQDVALLDARRYGRRMC